MVRGALIGCGFFAQNHLHAWGDVDGATLVAVCDVDGAKAQAAAAMFGIAGHHTDAAAMFAAEKLDFVDIVTTMETHRALVELAARHRVPTICQKPFAPTMADARAMVAACEVAGVALMVHENFRWQTPLLAVRAVLDSGVIGRPYFARVSFRTGYDVYANQPYLATADRFILLDMGVHVLDVARWLMGEGRTADLPHGPGQARHRRRGRGDHAVRPCRRRRQHRRLQLCDAGPAGPVPGDADRDRRRGRLDPAGARLCHDRQHC